MKKFSEIFKAPEALRRRRAIVEPPLKLYPETIISSVKTRAVKVRAVNTLYAGRAEMRVYLCLL